MVWLCHADAKSNWTDSCEKKWLGAGTIGLSTHYFPLSPDQVEATARTFDVNAVAGQLADAGASWFVFTLQHQNWLLMAPNKAFGEIVGSTKYAATRDVAAELADALAERNIRLVLYVNIRLDPDSHAPEEIQRQMGGWPPSDALIGHMASVYREYSLRYGKRVAGWWVDSAGVPAFVQSPSRERWFKVLAGAMRAGNPDALVAFNPGVRIERYSAQDDYTAGESNELKTVPEARCLDGVQWHEWSYLGGWWGSDGRRFADKQLCEYAARVTRAGGVMTLDVGSWGVVRQGLSGKPTSARPAGILDPGQIAQIRDLMQHRSMSNDAGGVDRFNCDQ
jgi:hypothetical protein